MEPRQAGCSISSPPQQQLHPDEGRGRRRSSGPPTAACFHPPDAQPMVWQGGSCWAPLPSHAPPAGPSCCVPSGTFSDLERRSKMSLMGPDARGRLLRSMIRTFFGFPLPWLHQEATT